MQGRNALGIRPGLSWRHTPSIAGGWPPFRVGPCSRRARTAGLTPPWGVNWGCTRVRRFPSCSRHSYRVTAECRCALGATGIGASAAFVSANQCRADSHAVRVRRPMALRRSTFTCSFRSMVHSFAVYKVVPRYLRHVVEVAISAFFIFFAFGLGL